jgi:hypothetical protein
MEHAGFFAVISVRVRSGSAASSAVGGRFCRLDKERPRPRGGRGLRIIGRGRRSSERGQGGGRPQSLRPHICGGRPSPTIARWAVQLCVLEGGQKKGSITKMEPYESGANGRGRRKRRLPMGPAEGGGFGADPCRETSGPREEVQSGVSATLGICRRQAVSTMERVASQPCTPRGEGQPV